MTLNMFETLSHRTKVITFEEVRQDSLRSNKDMTIMLSSFDACTKLLNWREMNILTQKQRLDLFFVDFDLIPLLIQENYLTSMGEAQGIKDITRMAEAAEFIALGDVFVTTIRRDNQWSLLRD